MSLHSDANYECKSCHTPFIPFPQSIECPKCGRKSTTIFRNFIELTIRSALFNVASRNTFIPGAWGFVSTGDTYYWMAFNFLRFSALSLKVNEKDMLGQFITEDGAKGLISKFLETINFGRQGYMVKVFEIYFTSLICPPDTKIEKKTDVKKKGANKISCFLCHSNADKTFTDKLYKDLGDNGIDCWYFPEDATYGKGVWSNIGEEIHTCKKVIGVCSEDSLKSSAVLGEIERTIQREESEGKDILVPIRIDDYVLNGWNHPRKPDVVKKVVGDFQLWKNKQQYGKSLQRLIDAIQS